MKTLSLFLLFFWINVLFADNFISVTDSANFLPKGEYRLFGDGRGNVSNVEKKIRLESSSMQRQGNFQIEVKKYQGRLTYQQNFENHGWQEHQPFSNVVQREFNSETSKPTIGGQTFTNLKVKAFEIHPADAYDGIKGGDYPEPTGARDEYTYNIAATEINSKIIFDNQDKPQTAYLDNSSKTSVDFNELNQAQNISHTSFTYDEKSDYVHLNFSNTYNNNTNRSSRNWEDITKTLSSMSNAEVRDYFSNEDNLVEFFTSGNASIVYLDTPSVSPNISQSNNTNNYKNSSENGEYNIYISDEELYDPDNLYAKVNLIKLFTSTAKKANKKADKNNKAEELKKVQEEMKKLSKKNRDSMSFTPAGKKLVIKQNQIKNDGITKCEICGVNTVPAKKSVKGVSPPKNETQIDHIVPKSKGGSGNPTNGQLLCRDCNIRKGNK